ncbi:MAG: AAA family ATPase [Planctomycetota bacterium]|nr:AAA family ATPase [Planctomycetota bacterium]
MSDRSDSPPNPATRVIALLNQKGGVGKTTSTVNVGAALAEMGKRVCLVDMDPQGHLSLHLGVDGESVGETVYELLLEPDVSLEQVAVKVRPNLSCLPSRVDLAAAETELSQDPDRHRRLASKFASHFDRFDYVLLDCPPSLGVLTLNALAMAQEVFVPMQAHFLAMQGVGKLFETVGLVCQGVNPDLKVSGVILCMHEKLSTHVREVVGELEEFFEEHRGSPMPWADARVLRPAIRKNIKLAEAPSFGQTIFDYAPWCPGAIDYRKLAERIDAGHGSASSDASPTARETPTEHPTVVEIEVGRSGDLAEASDEKNPSGSVVESKPDMVNRDSTNEASGHDRSSSDSTIDPASDASVIAGTISAEPRPNPDESDGASQH